MSGVVNVSPAAVMAAARARRRLILYQEQASELDPKRRAAILHKIQQLMHERVVFAPLLEPALLNGYGPRVADSGLGLIVGHLYSAPVRGPEAQGEVSPRRS